MAANFTKTFHHEPYPALTSESTHTYSGKTILVTGSSEGIGYAIAKAFALAKASQVILIGRRPETLEAAVASLNKLEAETHFVSMVADVFDGASIQNLWQNLADRNISVDGLILNAAKTDSDGSVDDEIALFNANVTANIRMLGCFLGKEKGIVASNPGSEKGKFFINITSGAGHWNPCWSGLQSYCASKAAFSSYVQHVATQTKVEDCLMFNVHPGAVYTSAAERAGVPREMAVWDEVDLPGAFCVWVSKQTFLHGRFVWSNWDVEELISMKHQILNDPGMLKIGLQGVANTDPDEHWTALRAKLSQ